MNQTPAEQLTDEQLFTLFREQIERDDNLLRELVAYRKKLNLNQDDIARLMETDQSYVSRLENGSINPRMRTLREYAAALGVEIHHTIKQYSPNGFREDLEVELVGDRADNIARPIKATPHTEGSVSWKS